MSEALAPSNAAPAELREPRLHERLAVVLAGEIVSERMRPGESFPSAEQIVKRFSVSRTVAREAVQTLSMVGLVHVQHGKRTEVLPSDAWDILSAVVQEALRRERRAAPLIRDLYELRLLIEPAGAAWMAERGSEEDVDELAHLAAEMAQQAGGGATNEQVLGLDRDFHNLISRAGGNRVLAAVSRDIREVLSTLWALSLLDRRALVEVAAQHTRIAEAIRRRDEAEAAAAMRQHLEWARAQDLALMKDET